MSETRTCPKCKKRNGMMYPALYHTGEGKAECDVFCTSCNTRWLFRYKEVGYQEIKEQSEDE